MAKYTATITFTSGDTLDDHDVPMAVTIDFSPDEDSPEGIELEESGLEPPAFIIARQVFMHHIKPAVLEYLDGLGREMVEDIHVEMEDSEEWIDDIEDAAERAKEPIKH